jgi:H+/Cl- antiporter ClcA
MVLPFSGSSRQIFLTLMSRLAAPFFVILRWLALLGALAFCVGSAAAFFLWALDAVTLLRFSQPWLLYLLPLVGLAMGAIYQTWGKSVQITGETPAPLSQIAISNLAISPVLILFSTLATHLCGGSAGREGTALQMGGGLAACFARWRRLTPATGRLLFRAGVAAGFGSVFGTPLAGAVFALEVARKSKVHGRLRTFVACLVSSFLADATCRAWGIHHTAYVVSRLALLDFWLWGKVLLAATAFALVAWLYTFLSHRLSAVFEQHIPKPARRPFIGGCLVIGLYFLVGTPDYLGLGVLGNRPDAITLPALFSSASIPASAWAWKLAFTVITLTSGFKGGEVTPLFFIGAALGNTLALALHAPIDLFASLGFVAVFAAASKTPCASILLGIELFGGGNAPYLAVACFIAYRLSGQQSIYPRTD